MSTQKFDGITFVSDERGYYYNSTHGKIYMHRYVWEYYNGPIPKNHEIHHIDFDRSNNDISNLQLMTKSEHRKIHADLLTDEQREWKRNNLNEKARPKAIEWHKSEEGRQWHREQLSMQRELGIFKHKLICTNCGKTYVGEVNGPNTFCSNACKSAYRRRSGKNLEERICVVCGNPFMTDKYKNAKTCSRSCANRYRAMKRGR